MLRGNILCFSPTTMLHQPWDLNPPLYAGVRLRVKPFWNLHGEILEGRLLLRRKQLLESWFIDGGFCSSVSSSLTEIEIETNLTLQAVNSNADDNLIPNLDKDFRKGNNTAAILDRIARLHSRGVGL